MPPSDPTPAAAIRHLTRLLAALAYKEPKGELRIRQSLLAQLAGEGSARALFEDYDSKTEEVVLRFREKSLATYLIEEPCPTSHPPMRQDTTQTTVPSGTVPTPPTQSTRSSISLPLTDAQLARVERAVRQKRMALAIKQEQSAPVPPLS